MTDQGALMGLGAIGEMLVKIGVDMTPFAPALAKADALFDSFSGRMRNTASGQGSLIGKQLGQKLSDSFSQNVNPHAFESALGKMGILAGAGAGLAGFKMEVDLIVNMAALGDALDDVRSGFRELAGEQSQALLEAMRAGSAGRVSDESLYKQGAKLQAFLTESGPGPQAQELEQVMGAVVAAGEKFGVEAEPAMNRVVSAIQRGNTMGLRQIGILIDQKAALKDYADLQDKTVGELTRGERAQATWAAVVKETAQMGTVQNSSLTDNMDVLNNQIKNLKVNVGSTLNNSSFLASIAGWAGKAVEGVNKYTLALQDERGYSDKFIADLDRQKAAGEITGLQYAWMQTRLSDLGTSFELGKINADQFRDQLEKLNTTAKASADAAWGAQRGTLAFGAAMRAAGDDAEEAEGSINGYSASMLAAAGRLANFAALDAKIRGAKVDSPGTGEYGEDPKKWEAWAAEAAKADTARMEQEQRALEDTTAARMDYWKSIESQTEALARLQAQENNAKYDTAEYWNLRREREGLEKQMAKDAEGQAKQGADKAKADAERQAAELKGIVSGIMVKTDVTAEDMLLSNEGAYIDKWDEYMRRFRAKKGVTQREIAAEEKAFYGGQRMDQVNWDAIVNEAKQQAAQKVGQEAMLQEAMKRISAAGLNLSPAEIKQTLGIKTTPQEQMAENIGQGAAGADMATPITKSMMQQFQTQREEWVAIGNQAMVWFGQGAVAGVNAELAKRMVTALGPQLQAWLDARQADRK